MISKNGVLPFKAAPVAPDSVARALKVGTLVEGTLTQAGDRLRVSISLVNASTGTEIGSKTLERPREQIFALQDDLAKEVAIFLRQRLGRELELQGTRAGTRNVRAWELLQKALTEARGADPLVAEGDTAAAARRYQSADSILVAAERLDPTWAAPPTQRAWFAYRRGRLADVEKVPNDVWSTKGLEHAARALKLKPNDPDALEVRGTLQYWRWLLNLEPDADKAKKLLASAEADLRASVAANPMQASAWTTLSHLLINKIETAEAKLAALRAYESDPYLANANVTLFRSSRPRRIWKTGSRPDTGARRVIGGFPRIPGSPSARSGSFEGSAARHSEGLEAPGSVRGADVSRLPGGRASAGSNDRRSGNRPCGDVGQ